MIYSLIGLDDKDATNVGSKAMSLSWLHQHGFKIAEGFVIGADTYRTVVEHGSLTVTYPKRSVYPLLRQGIFL
jgi:phosphoenolpyruvate synthase/pyruvate phosphate dikinase